MNVLLVFSLDYKSLADWYLVFFFELKYSSSVQCNCANINQNDNFQLVPYFVDNSKVLEFFHLKI